MHLAGTLLLALAVIVLAEIVRSFLFDRGVRQEIWSSFRGRSDLMNQLRKFGLLRIVMFLCISIGLLGFPYAWGSINGLQTERDYYRNRYSPFLWDALQRVQQIKATTDTTDLVPPNSDFRLVEKRVARWYDADTVTVDEVSVVEPVVSGAGRYFARYLGSASLGQADSLIGLRVVTRQQGSNVLIASHIHTTWSRFPTVPERRLTVVEIDFGEPVGTVECHISFQKRFEPSDIETLYFDPRDRDSKVLGRFQATLLFRSPLDLLAETSYDEATKRFPYPAVDKPEELRKRIDDLIEIRRKEWTNNGERRSYFAYVIDRPKLSFPIVVFYRPTANSPS